MNFLLLAGTRIHENHFLYVIFGAESRSEIEKLVRRCFHGVSRKLVRFWKVLDVLCAKNIVSPAAIYTF